MGYKTVEELIANVEESIRESENFTNARLPKDVEDLRGMSSPKIRRFLNRLCSFGPCEYLEIGTWAGSTFIPAIYGNPEAKGHAIDNFSQFTPDQQADGYDARKALYANLERFKDGVGERWSTHEGDCFDQVAIQSAGDCDVFFYDGNHDEPSTERAIVIYGAKQRKPFVLVVDDWELAESVKKGTERALEDCFTVHKTWHLKKQDGYHEGVFVAVIQ